MSRTYNPTELAKFKRQLVLFVNDLIIVAPGEKDLYAVRFFIENTIPITTIVDEFYNRILPCREQIKSRNQDFFLNESSNMFSGLSNNKITHFSTIWKSNLDTEDRDSIWNWVDVLVRQADKCEKK